MVTVGIDCGVRTVRTVLLEDGEVLSKRKGRAGGDLGSIAADLYVETIKRAGILREKVTRVVATGSGRHQVGFRDSEISEITAGAKGAAFLIPWARTVVDIGAEEAKAIRIGSEGKVLDFALNDKCASGVGVFVEAMARALEVSLEEMWPLALEGESSVQINSQCIVFAETEVISLVHSRKRKADVAEAIHDAIAERVVAMGRKAGFEPDIVLIGGLAKNVGFIQSISRVLKMKVVVPQDPEFVSALGAALFAAQHT